MYKRKSGKKVPKKMGIFINNNNININIINN